jgi:glycerol-3-phosphate O-acyltransferase/dihydroxyacetone phosphate acyltransferase
MYNGATESFVLKAEPVMYNGEQAQVSPHGWRYAKEVVAFLREKGGKITSLDRGVEGQWAALSEGEGTPTEDSD